MSSTETLDAGHSRRSLVSSPSEQKKKSILKKSESGSSRSGGGSAIVAGSGLRTGGGDPERENLLMSDPESSAAETPVVSRKRLPISTASSVETSSAGQTVALPPTQLNCDMVRSLVGPKLRTSGTIINRGMSLTSASEQQNNHNNNGTTNMLTIKFVKLPDEERQRLAASNNVNNNVSSQPLPSVDFLTRGAPLTTYVATQRSNGMASKEIQTSSANLTSPTGAAGGGRKFERGRDPHRTRSPPARGEAIAMEGVSTVGTSTVASQQPPSMPRCSNLNCRHNVPSAAASTSNKRLVCLCGNPMTILPPEQQQQQLQQPNLINLRSTGEKPFLFGDLQTQKSEETKMSVKPTTTATTKSSKKDPIKS